MDDISFCCEDNKIVDESIELAYEWESYFDKIVDLIDTCDLMELVKLTEFAGVIYSENLDYLESLREKLEYAYKDIYFTKNMPDSRDAFREFFSSRVAKIADGKDIEKVKKV